MKSMMKNLLILTAVLAVASAGYMAYQHYYGAQQDSVKIQYALKKSASSTCSIPCITCPC